MPSTYVIEARDLTKQFDRTPILRDVDLQIAAGEVYGLIGPNGAGKTTLMRLFAMAEQPTIGEIYLNGEKVVYDRPQPELQRYIGYLPDDYPLYEDLTVWDYLDYFARLYFLTGRQRTRRLHEVLELVNLTHKRQSLVGTLSRGMKQRLGLARTIIHEPLLLLLDEPVSGLDPIARQQFRDIIITLRAAGMTILISSHVLSDLAEICTTIGIMEFGFLLESAPIADLYHRLSEQRLVIRSLANLDRIAIALKQFSSVQHIDWDRENQQIVATFQGGNDEAAEILRSLLHDDFLIHDFHCIQDSLEDIFFKLGHENPN